MSETRGPRSGLNQDKILSTLLVVLTITWLAITALPALANTPPPWTLSLDANSTSNTDATLESSHNLSSPFSIGAIINASSTRPVNGVYGWQFAIRYDNTSVIPQGGANGPLNGVQFGNQTGPGNPSWARQISLGNAFGSSTIHNVDTTHQKITVFFIFLPPSPPTSIAPILSPSVQGNLLANVNFTTIQTPTSNLIFSITDADFADNNANPIPNINPGSPVSENVPPSGGTQNPSTTQGLPGGPLPYIIAATAAAAILAVVVMKRRKAPTGTRGLTLLSSLRVLRSSG